MRHETLDDKDVADFYCREYARILLRVKSVRVERLQDITEADARAEGVSSAPWYIHYGIKTDGEQRDISGNKFQGEHASYKNGFATLWDSLNAKRGYGWDANPWLWVISFERLK